MRAKKLRIFGSAVLVTGVNLLAGAPAHAQPPAACALLVEVVDADGMRIDARIEVVGADASSPDLPDGRRCVEPAQDQASATLLVTADGFQPFASEPLTLVRGANRPLTVTLTPPFAEALTVQGRATSLVGISASASEGVVGAAELAARPLIKGGDLLEVVPGVAMTQHSSGGHAPIILLRGYNLDHGTDFASFVEGAPMNLPSHAHGQGYTDFNWVIPELVERVDFQKGPYAARVGNFGTAGSSNIELASTVAAPFARVEGGGNGYYRAVGAASTARGDRRFLIGGEVSHDDGPNVVPDDYGRVKGLARYARGDAARNSSLTLSTYRSNWTASDGYPRRAFERGYIDRFGTLDASDGGSSQQHVLIASRRTTTAHALTHAGAYVRYYDLDLFSNLTFWTNSPLDGDQIRQSDRRVSTGGHASYSRLVNTGWGRAELTGGVQARHDEGRVGLQNTVRRRPQDKLDVFGRVMPAQVFDTRIGETAVSAYAESRLTPAPWVRIVAGVRGDVFRMRVRSDREANSGNATDGIVSPKVSIALGPWKHAEAYANAGLGFHSNHAAGVTQRVDPMTGTEIHRDGTPVVPTPALVPTRGAELGLRLQPAPFAQTSLALWFLGSDSELLYTPEDGVTSPERPGRRYGLEWLNYVQVRRWLVMDLDAAWSSARYTIDPLGEGRAITDTARAVITSGLSVTQRRVTGSLRARYIGRRPLLPDESVFLASSLVFNGQAEVRLTRRLRLAVQGFNLLNRTFEDTAYYFATRLRDPRDQGPLEAAALDDYVTRPGQPRVFRMALRVGL